MVVQCVSAMIQVAAIVISARGTIANPHPRRHLKWILYLQTVFFAVELVWECVGVAWTFDPTLDCPLSHRVLVITRAVFLWNVIMSIFTAAYIYLRMGLHLLCCAGRRVPKKLRYEKWEPSTSFSGRRLSRLSSHSLTRHNLQRKWQWLLQSLLCCMSLGERRRIVYQEVSATIADAFVNFRGYVPSDIAAGMVLVKMKQKSERVAKEELIKNCPSSGKPLDLTEQTTVHHIEKLVHFMNFSMAPYGWMLYIYSKGLRGLLQLLVSSLSFHFLKQKPHDHDLQPITAHISGDNWLKWNTLAVLKWADIREVDLIHAEFSKNVYCPTFIVTIDHIERSVVVAVRGTLSISDTLIDLSAQPSLLLTKEGSDFYAHQGVKETAQSLHLKLEGEGILQRLFHIYPTYKLIITGHSLGGGVAALLAMLLKPVYPKLHCYAFSPPGGLINSVAMHYTKSFITTIVLGSDLVPRLSMQNFELFSNEILHQLENCQKPKYQIFLTSFMQWIGIRSRLLTVHAPFDKHRTKNKEKSAKTRSVIKRTQDDSTEEEELFDVDSDSSTSSHHTTGSIVSHTVDPITGKSRIAPRAERPSLFLPGQIVHLVWSQSHDRYSCFKRSPRQVTAHLREQSDFSELIIDEDMVSDHMPNIVLNALQSLNDSCQEI